MQTTQSTIDQIFASTNSTEITSKETVRNKLISLINELINKDFHALLQLLYRIDVSEKKIRSYLEKNQEDSAAVLADLIIERQLEKIESRKKFRGNNFSHDDEEKW